MIKMYGPAVNGSGRIVNRDVAEADEVVYANLGYKRGTIVEEPASKEEVKAEKAKDKQDAAVAAELKAEVKAEAKAEAKEAADAKKATKK